LQFLGVGVDDHLVHVVPHRPDRVTAATVVQVERATAG
jgi:hypothetical protein